jgi:hypothetical protein
LLGVAALGLALALAGCSKSPEVEKAAIPKSFNFMGDVRLSGAGNVTGDLANCSGVGRFVDMYKSANVVVTNQKGKPLAFGTVIEGLGTNYFHDVLDECAFGIQVLNVPRAKGYFIVVGRQRAYPITLAGVVATNGQIAYDANPPTVRAPLTPTTTVGIP